MHQYPALKYVLKSQVVQNLTQNIYFTLNIQLNVFSFIINCLINSFCSFLLDLIIWCYSLSLYLIRTNQLVPMNNRIIMIEK